MKKTGIYIRQSLDEKMQKYSLKMQETSCLDMAREKEMIVHQIYNEGNRSARKTEIEERPVLQQLLLDAQNGTIGKDY